VTPDLITTAKALTGAVVPAGAVLAQEAIYRAVSLKRLLDESPWLQFTSECQRF
jgi:adenosylmethionine-8-amino-7-oxononanoate aminotransferase